MDSALLIMLLFAVSGVIGVLLAWAINTFIFACVLRQSGRSAAYSSE